MRTLLLANQEQRALRNQLREERQKRVLALRAEGLDYTAIARRLGVSRDLVRELARAGE